MVAAGLLASRFAGIFNGYTFHIISLGSTFEVAAIPSSPDVGRYCFYGTPDGVIRYSTYEPPAPPGLGGNPCRVAIPSTPPSEGGVLLNLAHIIRSNVVEDRQGVAAEDFLLFDLGNGQRVD